MSYKKLIFTRNFTTNRRVVVTGLGVTSAVGLSVESAWKFILSGKSAVRNLPINEEYSRLPCKVAAAISDEDQNIIQSDFSNTELKSMSTATVYAMFATKQAFASANWIPESIEQRKRTGVAVGMGMIDLNDICETNKNLSRAYNRVSPFFVPRILVNMAAGQISIKYKLMGPNHAVSTACATGLHSIGDAFRFIKHDDADVMVCGATEACINPLSIAGFCRLRALSTSFNELPTEASRPFDTKRDGFVMGEGATIFILEELEHAEKRGAKIFAEILGYGLSGDASHLTAPSEDGLGAQLAMERAIHDAKLEVCDISYVNAHATSTPLGDSIEARSIKKIFNDQENISVSSTKGSHGHLLGAAGAIECMFTVLACRDGFLPPTINLNQHEDEFKEMNFVPNKHQNWNTNEKRRIALKNSFGFGGTNVSLCIGEFIK
ncbi:CLUMA_CG005313, isoform A [Clunio marinus]|uniref:3-oxoacyl-[acyl-carrier-protein] synthase n=1 Tax=Clunio marinus TaxID=568069 RepID=A0A1J1HUB4_9DIPT|nr:CLUMA_CG005313, isoform A [Clunio marinus]